MDIEMDVRGRDVGVTLVLLHGFPLDRRVWEPVAALLAERMRVVLVDLPGFGSSGPVVGFSMDDAARTVRGALMRRGLLPCVLGGLSMGGYVALAYHRAFASDLRGLILTDTKSEADTSEGRANRDRMAEIAAREGSEAIARLMFPKMLAPQAGEDLGRRLMKIMTACPPATIVAALRAMRDRPDYTPDLRRTTVPVLVVCGEHDAITPPGGAKALSEAVGASSGGSGGGDGGELAVIAGAGHMAPLERPAEVARVIGEFVSRRTA